MLLVTSIIDDLNYSNFNNNNKVERTLESLSDNFALNKEDILHPTSFKTIMRFQQKINLYLKLSRKSLKTIPLNSFMGQVRCILLSVKTRKL